MIDPDDVDEHLVAVFCMAFLAVVIGYILLPGFLLWIGVTH